MSKSFESPTFLIASCLLALVIGAVQLDAQTAYVVHHAGPQLLAPSGQPLLLRGAMLEFTEYFCSDPGQFDNNKTDIGKLTNFANVPQTVNDLVAPFKTWNMNAVRIPLNEDCWLGSEINNPPGPYGTAYVNAVDNLVRLFTDQGLYVILDVHASAPAGHPAVIYESAPDPDHTATFWTQVATHFMNNGNVIFDLFNEPYERYGQPNDNTAVWNCWKNGNGPNAACTASSYPTYHSGTYFESAYTWKAAGMQSLMDAVRGTGAKNFVLLEGQNYAGEFGGWLNSVVTDPINNFGASNHAYNGALQYQLPELQTILTSGYPVVAGEFGSQSGYAPEIVSQVASYGTYGISYIAWTWDSDAFTTNGGLIQPPQGSPLNYAVPTNPFGQTYKDSLANSGFPQLQYALTITSPTTKCLDNYGANTASTPTVTWDCAGNPDQTWRVVSQGNGYFQVATGINYCLTGGTDLVTNATCNGSDNQMWSIVGLGNSQYELVNKQDQRCLDNWGSNNNGTQVHEFSCAQDAYQKWSLL